MCRLIVLRGITGAGKTSVGEELRRILNRYKLLELDDIKIKKYGTTKKCDPKTDFSEFGRQVKKVLESGSGVIAIEAFIDQEHIDSFLHTTGRSYSSKETYFVWLECSLENSKKRKSRELESHVVEDQHNRLEGRFEIDQEYTVNTDDKEIIDVANEIIRSFKLEIYE